MLTCGQIFCLDILTDDDVKCADGKGNCSEKVKREQDGSRGSAPGGQEAGRDDVCRGEGELRVL